MNKKMGHFSRANSVNFIFQWVLKFFINMLYLTHLVITHLLSKSISTAAVTLLSNGELWR